MVNLEDRNGIQDEEIRKLRTTVFEAGGIIERIAKLEVQVKVIIALNIATLGTVIAIGLKGLAQ